MCFDMTYQTKSLNQLMVGGKRVLVGGVWLPDQPTNAMAPLGDDNLCVKSIKRATQMCEFLLWDPSMAKKVPLSACELPMEMNWSGIQARLFASLYVLEAVGTVLLASEDRVQALTLDAATSHHLVRKWLLGQPSDATKESLGDEIPFFSELKHYPLPDHSLPRLPVQLCSFRGSTFWCLPGACLLDPLGKPLFLGGEGVARA